MVCGAGAIGMAMGGYLASAGYRVLLLTRDSHAAKIARDGLRITGAAGDLHVAVPALASAAQIQWDAEDVLLLTSKSQDTSPLLLQLSSAPRSLPVFCFQNGIRNEEWAKREFPHVYGGLVNFSATVVGPGTVEHTRSDQLAVGRHPNSLDDTTGRVAEALSRAGFQVTEDAEVMAWKWGKLILNLNNAVYALTDTWVERAFSLPPYRAFMAETMREGVGVTRAGGIEPRMEPGSRIDAFIESLESAGSNHPALQGEPGGSRTYPSTWQDLSRRRSGTEVPYFNGEVVEMGFELGLPTPYNSTLLELIREAVERSAAPGQYTLEDLEATVRDKT